ncbi:hypothetical protein EJP67_28110 [Variovorax guangxiensis]|uniref:Uncharacterized protein n=1 Tax=Variovorax guangxiensis TaxID=1775474 RepID=A0A3S1A6N4_9BURK|nr:hypothetical protein [Variovorax guangxiensis]RUR70929.1 hypothetical protein EJP67_28110 [Variovorax guangxiensis]
MAADATTPPFAESGVLMFAYTTPLPVGYLNAFSTQQVRTGKPIAGVPIQRSAVRTLYAARNRMRTQFEAQAALFPVPADAAKHTFRHLGEREFDWARSEGLFSAIAGTEPGTARAMMQRVPHPIPPHMLEGISRLNMEAKRKDVYMLMFTHFDDEADAIRFRDATSELFDVAVCEHDPLFHTAFSIHNSTTESGLLVDTQQDILVQVRAEGQHHRFSTEAFIAAQVIDRVIWKMRCDGASLDKIASVVGLNKSSVKRRLDKMRTPRPAEVSDNWRKTYDGSFNIPPRGGHIFDNPAED